MSNLSAFLRVIREGESSQDDSAYRTIVGGGRFDSFADHPRQLVYIQRLDVRSTAAGAYQILSRTWDECKSALGLPDFSPDSQDKAATFLIKRRGALADVEAGRIETAIAKCAKEWASLPGSPYGQPVMKMAKALSVYRQFGGSLVPVSSGAGPTVTDSFIDTMPAGEAPDWTPPKEPTMAALETVELVTGLAGSLFKAFAPLAEEKLAKEMGRHTQNPELAQQIATAAVDAAKSFTGKSDPVEAVVAARADPQTMAKIEAVTMERLAQLAPLMERMAVLDRQQFEDEEKSRAAAAARPRAQDHYLTRSIIVLTSLILGASVAALVIMALMNVNTTIIMAVFSILNAGALLVFSKFGTRYDFDYGSSAGSANKDAVRDAALVQPSRRAP